MNIIGITFYTISLVIWGISLWVEAYDLRSQKSENHWLNVENANLKAQLETLTQYKDALVTDNVNLLSVQRKLEEDLRVSHKLAKNEELGIRNEELVAGRWEPPVVNGNAECRKQNAELDPSHIHSVHYNTLGHSAPHTLMGVNNG